MSTFVPSEENPIRRAWNNDAGKWYFAIVDVIAVLTGSPNPQVDWRVMKKRLLDEGNQTVTDCHGLKMTASDGTQRMTDVGSAEQLLRIIQSIPSLKAEPFKLWLAHVGSERPEKIESPELVGNETRETSEQNGPSDSIPDLSKASVCITSWRDCWAKTDSSGQPGVSVRGHCVSVGMVAEQLAASGNQSIALLAALHDIGKVSPGFQRKCAAWIVQYGLAQRAEKERWASAESDHSKVSQFTIGRLLAAGMTRGNAQAWAAAIGAHHGSIHGYSERGLNAANGMCDDAWDAERQSLVAELERVFGPLTAPSFAPTDARLWAIAGLISVADWIGSDERWFPPERDITDAESRAQAEQSVATLGMCVRHIQPGFEFDALFGFPPNSLQRAVLDVVKKPGIYILEAPMGMGKTEAALAAAYRLLAERSASGVYFALPTQATSNRIHSRMGPFIERISGGEHGVRLIHSMSWLREDLYVPTLRPSAADAEAKANAREAAAWFRGAKRAILEPFGVGTVDQALLGVVAAKHFFVRLHALAGKVVVLDEVHSYDRYTGTLIDALIRELEALGSTVLILSATLTRQRVAELLQRDVAQIPDGFPRIIGRAYGESEILHATAAPPPPKTVHLSFREREAAMDAAVTAARDGACVLWICDTVNSAQDTAGLLKSLKTEGGPEIALLHSRFPFFRREELETTWLDALGPPSAGKQRRHGCILVSTQIVEQSVDVDADLLITELAPTDMLLQRIGRLWRHERPRPVDRAEAWILAERASLDELRTLSAKSIREVFGAKGKVYAPYILLRTLVEWTSRPAIAISADIRPLLEATYAPPMPSEPTAWSELREDMETKMNTHRGRAHTAANRLKNPALDDDEGIQTRLNEQPTINVVLALDAADPKAVSLLNGDLADLTVRDFQIATARSLQKNLVRVPLYFFEKPTANEKLARHGAHGALLLTVESGGTVIGARLAAGISLRYTPFRGLEATKLPPAQNAQQRPIDEDEPYD